MIALLLEVDSIRSTFFFLMIYFQFLILCVVSLNCAFATAYLGQVSLETSMISNETRFLISMGLSLLNKGWIE